MREIKFRGKSKKDGKWLYGDLLRNVDGDFAVVQPFGIHLNNYCEPYEVDPDTIGQFTGLKDRDGTDVWEGDLLRTPEGDIMIVEWEDAQIITRCVRPHNPRYKNSLTFAYPVSVVIGNIHDSPELLEDTK